MLAEIVRGLRRVGNGAQGPARGDATGAMVVASGHGLYCEPSSNGTVMIASTAVGGVAPGTALSTTPPFALWNPPSSGYNLNILKAALGYVSGTLGAGSLLYAYYASQATVPSTGSELVPVNCQLGFPRGVGRVFQGSTLSGTPAILRPAFMLGAFVGGANPPQDSLDLIDGAITVPPGAVFVMQGLAGAGTSPLVLLAAEWEEIPIV